MVKKLSAIGGALGVVIEAPILEMLQIGPDTELDVVTDGERVVITPLRSSRVRRLDETATRVMDAHDEALRKLAR